MEWSSYPQPNRLHDWHFGKYEVSEQCGTKPKLVANILTTTLVLYHIGEVTLKDTGITT